MKKLLFFLAAIGLMAGFSNKVVAQDVATAGDVVTNQLLKQLQALFGRRFFCEIVGFKNNKFYSGNEKRYFRCI